MRPGKPMAGYFIRSPFGGAKQPVLISFGGLDSFKDELWFMTGRGALQRGIVRAVDGRAGAGRDLAPPRPASRDTTTRCRSANASTGSPPAAMST